MSDITTLEPAPVATATVATAPRTIRLVQLGGVTRTVEVSGDTRVSTLLNRLGLSGKNGTLVIGSTVAQLDDLVPEGATSAVWSGNVCGGC